MAIYISMAVFISIACLTWFIIRQIFAERIAIGARLSQMAIHTAPKGLALSTDELSGGFQDRVWNPILEKIFTLIQKYTPVRKKDFIEQRLDYAGRLHGWDSYTYLTVQYAIAVAAAPVGLVIGLFSGKSIFNSLLYGLGGLIIGYLLVDFYLNNAIVKHQKGIERELPDALDLLTISIEAGLGFDASMQRVVEKATGPLATEFNQTIQEMRIGKTRREALRDLSLRNGVSDLTKFVDAIMQADQLGVSLGNVLRNQSDQIRVLRRQRVEEQAMKAPVKMLIPMVLFIFPTIFIVILAPAIIQLMDVVSL